MLKKIILITISVLVVIGAIAGVFLFKKFTYQDEETKFRKSLKGEIVFVRQDGLYENIYKINANGTGERMLYHHKNKLNSNAFHPIWSEDGSKIYFVAMTGDDWKNSEWRKFIMDADGKNVKATEEKDPYIITEPSREDDIIVEFGNIYYLNEKEEKNLIYRHKNYDFYKNSGSGDISWSPDKKYIICNLDGYITVINKEGTKMAKITKGIEPDWKY